MNPKRQLTELQAWRALAKLFKPGVRIVYIPGKWGFNNRINSHGLCKALDVLCHHDIIDNDTWRSIERKVKTAIGDESWLDKVRGPSLIRHTFCLERAKELEE